MDKLKKLKAILEKMGSVLVAYSGGVDSTFLLKVAYDILGDNVLAVTALSPTYPKEELDFSKRTAKRLGVRHKVIRTDELSNIRFASNPVNRCYFCKKELFSRLRGIARVNQMNFVADATNLSDAQDFRPGSKAKEELKIRSPLKEAGFSKNDIRRLSRRLGLSSWNKPALACLASRIPYGKKITPQILNRVNRAEQYLKRMGFKQVRLRHYNGLCRIEVNKEYIPLLVSKRSRIVQNLKRLGYNYVTVDLEGYRTGSMNPVFSKRDTLNMIRKNGVNEVRR